MVWNTNNKTALVNGIGVINQAGYYDVSAILTLTNVAVGNITATFYSDNTAIDGLSVTATSSALTDNIIIPLVDVLKVLPSMYPTRATVSVRLSADATVVSGSQFTIENRR